LLLNTSYSMVTLLFFLILPTDFEDVLADALRTTVVFIVPLAVTEAAEAVKTDGLPNTGMSVIAIAAIRTAVRSLFFIFLMLLSIAIISFFIFELPIRAAVTFAPEMLCEEADACLCRVSV